MKKKNVTTNDEMMSLSFVTRVPHLAPQSESSIGTQSCSRAE